MSEKKQSSTKSKINKLNIENYEKKKSESDDECK